MKLNYDYFKWVVNRKDLPKAKNFKDGYTFGIDSGLQTYIYFFKKQGAGCLTNSIQLLGKNKEICVAQLRPEITKFVITYIKKNYDNFFENNWGWFWVNNNCDILTKDYFSKYQNVEERLTFVLSNWYKDYQKIAIIKTDFDTLVKEIEFLMNDRIQ